MRTHDSASGRPLYTRQLYVGPPGHGGHPTAMSPVDLCSLSKSTYGIDYELNMFFNTIYVIGAMRDHA